MRGFLEENLENAVIERMVELGYSYDYNSDSWAIERTLDSFINDAVLYAAIKRINPTANKYVIEQAISTIKNIDSPSLFERNHIFHNYLVDGINIEDYHSEVNPLIKLIDFDNIDNNIFQLFNQIKYNEGKSTRIPDIVLYINGLPLVVFELKSIEHSNETFLEKAYEQLGRNNEADGYRYDIPTLFNYNAFLVISDGASSKVGTLTSDLTRYSEWKSIGGEIGYKKNYAYKLDVLLKGMLTPERLLDVIKNNLFFMQKDKEKPLKILTQYHQYFGVIKAYDSIKKTIKPKGDGKAGIVWHTQGSGKSFSMVMLAHKLIKDLALENPTIVVLTDRNDLDEQLFTTFSNANEFLRTSPKKVESRQDLLNTLSKIKKGGIIFTTIQKFDKERIVPNERENIIVLSDEAHRSHYGIDETVTLKKSEQSIELISKFGYAKYIRDALPNATFIGYTGTPVSTKDHSTTAIFGEVVDTYDMTQSIEDDTTVKIFYESRLAKVWLDENKLKEIETYYEDLTNGGVDDIVIDESKRHMSRMELVVGDEDRLVLLAKDILKHYSDRKDILNGKAMIVCMSRKIAKNLYNQLVSQDESLSNKIALVVTESNKDTAEERELFKDKYYRDNMAKEFKKKDSAIKIAIVVDMWLTGFDVTDLDVMYIDKPMKGHNLMQAIARVNRVHQGKESGLIVDYIGIHKYLEEALDMYTARDKEFNIKDIQISAKALLDEKLSILDEMMYTVDKSRFGDINDSERLKAIQNGADFILSGEDRKKAYMKVAKALKDAYIVALGILDDDYKKKVLYYVAVRYFIQKIEFECGGGKCPSIAEINQTVSALIAEAIKGDEVKILTQVKDSDENKSVWDLLSDEKISALRKSNPPHIFIKIMEKLLKEAVAEYRKYNLVKSKEYSERLRRLLEVYNTREDDLQTDLTIVGLVSFSKDMVDSEQWANKNNLSGRERAFYDALASNKSAYDIMKDDTLRVIAIELKAIVEEYATVDWSKKKNTQAKMRMAIRKVLKKYNYPPDFREDAVERVINQAEFMM